MCKHTRDTKFDFLNPTLGEKGDGGSYSDLEWWPEPEEHVFDREEGEPALDYARKQRCLEAGKRIEAAPAAARTLSAPWDPGSHGPMKCGPLELTTSKMDRSNTSYGRPTRIPTPGDGVPSNDMAYPQKRDRH
jgi:hypothetical protein